MNELERLEHLLRLVTDTARPHRLAGVLGNDLSDAPGLLVSLPAASEVILRRCEAGLQSIPSPTQRALAGRVLLGRRIEYLGRLSRFWTANGTPVPVVGSAVEAAQHALADWHGRVVDLSRDDARHLPPSSGYARFVTALGGIESQDAGGPLGNAVRASRYSAGSCRTVARPFLSGEERRPVGFPVALGRGAGAAPTLCEAAWVQPGRSWPGWLLDNSVVPPEKAIPGLAYCRALQTCWGTLVSRVNVALRSAGYDAALGEVALPEWLMLFVALYGVEDVESAGLALALQALAAGQDWPLPAGVGFSGAWGEDGRLRRIGRVREKMSAARDGGIFVLFVCAEAASLPADAAEDGLLLALLPPGASLPEVVRLVNTACHSLGLTADRGNWVSEAQHRRCRAMRSGSVPSRLLPEAAANSLPVGFVGREGEIGLLNGWRSEGAVGARSLAVLQGAMRVGKTTLISHWLQDRTAWPLYPIWFSCVRGHPKASRLEHVQEGLEAQILARFLLLPLPRVRAGECAQAPGHGDRWSRRTREVFAATGAAIDIVVDGIDEVREKDQEGVVDLVASLAGSGLTLIIGQAGTPALDRALEARRFELRADREAALCLIQGFARRLRAAPSTRAFGERLKTDGGWRQNLADRAGNNLWILTEVLDAILNGLAPAPSGPDDFSLRPVVKDYILQLLNEILESRPAGERSRLRALSSTLALLDVGAESWPASDLQRVSSVGTADQDLEEAAGGPLRRLLLFQGGGVRFRDDTFRQVIAAEALHRDRTRGRDLAVALVDILGGVAPPPSPFLEEYATAQAASFVLRYSGGDAPLAHRLLVRTSWLARRFRQATANVPSLGPFLEELRWLFHAATASEQAADLSPTRELLETLSHWRPAIEMGDVPGGRWWPRLQVVARGDIPAANPLATGGSDSQTRLLFSGGGYGPPKAGNCELNGAACGTLDGSVERIALAATRGRLLVYRNHAGEFVFERLHSFDSGAVAALKPLEESLVLAMTCGPQGESDGSSLVLRIDSSTAVHPVTFPAADPQKADPGGPIPAGATESPKEERRRLWLVDLASPLPPAEIDIPAKTVDFTLLHASEGDALLVLAINRDRCTVMQTFRLNYGRAQAADSPLQLVEDGGMAYPEYQVKHLCSFAPDTWAAFGTVGGDWQGECVLTVHRRSQHAIVEVTDTAVAKALRDGWITGLCSLPDNRLAAVRFPKDHDGTEGAALLILSQDGKIELHIPITPTPHGRHVAMLGSEVGFCSTYQPLGWHRHLHLLLGHSHSAYHCLTLEPEALPRALPAAVEQQVRYSDGAGTTLYSASPLEGGRVLLVFRGFAAVLGPGSSEITRVTREPAGSPCLLGATSAGSIAACEERYRDEQGHPMRTRTNHRYLHPPGTEPHETPVEEGFLEIGHGGFSLSLPLNGTRLLLTRAGQSPVTLYQTAADRGIPPHSMKRRILDVFAHDERNWAATVIALPADESANRADVRIFGQVNGQPMGLLIPDVDGEDPYDGFGFHIRSLCGTVLGIERAATERVVKEQSFFDLVLFDLPIEQDASEPCADYMGRRLDGREDHFYHPLIRLSEHWALVLGPLVVEALPYTEEAVFAVSQYRIGSGEPPSPIEGLTLGGRASVIEQSPGRADVLDLRRIGARTQAQVRPLHVDPEFGVRLIPQCPPAIDLGRSVNAVVVLNPGHAVVSYDAVPFRVEVRSLWPARGEQPVPPLAVSYLSEPPKQVLVSGGPHGVYLVVATESYVTWHDLGSVAAVRAAQANGGDEAARDRTDSR